MGTMTLDDEFLGPTPSPIIPPWQKTDAVGNISASQQFSFC